MLPRFVRFKGMLMSDDNGRTWICVRQHYLTNNANQFLEETLQGRRFRLIEDIVNERKQTTEG